jgi:hypothetical protein
MTDIRVIVTGSRSWDCPALADRLLRRMRDRYGDGLLVVHGACPTGVDAAFDRACRALGIRCEKHSADWKKLGKRAGPIRNGEMLSLGAVLVLAVHDRLARSKGTRDCVARALAAGIPVYLIASETAEPRRITEV